MKEIKEALEYTKLSISEFKAEVLLSEKLIDAIIAELNKVEEMRKTLEWYADKETYSRETLSKHGYIPIDQDNGERARQALKGEITND